MALAVDLHKSADKLTLSLQKSGLDTIPEIDVCFDLDVSGSYEDEHRDGITEALMTRLVPFCLVFDPNKQLDCFTFSNHERYVGMVNETNYQGFIKANIIGKGTEWKGGTEYAPVLRANLKKFGWGLQSTGSNAGAAPKKASWLSKILGGNAPAPLSAAELSAGASPNTGSKFLILFNTDGENSDHDQTLAVLQEINRKGYEAFVMFLAVSNQGGNFPFLHTLAKTFDNVDVTVIKNVREWVNYSDEQVHQELISEKLIKWLTPGT